MKESDAQIFWDLGIIAYELATGSINPFQNENFKVRLLLIERYLAPFPRNIPYSVSDDLKTLIWDLTTKEKNNRLGYSDQGGTQDVRQSPFFRDT